jgi:hypothetical protein
MSSLTVGEQDCSCLLFGPGAEIGILRLHKLHSRLRRSRHDDQPLPEPHRNQGAILLRQLPQSALRVGPDQMQRADEGPWKRPGRDILGRRQKPREQVDGDQRNNRALHNMISPLHEESGDQQQSKFTHTAEIQLKLSHGTIF